MTVQQIARISASAPLADIVAIIERDGGVIVEDFLSSEVVAEIMTAIEPHYKKLKAYDATSTHSELGKKFFPEGSTRIYGLLSRIPDQLTTILRSPVWQGVMERFLSDEYFSYVGEEFLPQKSGYMLSTSAAFRLVPGVKPQPFHRDQLTYQVRFDPSNPLFTPKIGCLVAGSNCTIKNGATLVIPGSHLWPHDRIPQRHEATHAEMRPGSALFTLGSTYHAAGTNVCEPEDPDAVRTLFAVFGQRDYYRHDQQEILTVPPELAQRLPEDIRKIVGYSKALGGTGYVENHQDPFELLNTSQLGNFRPSA